MSTFTWSPAPGAIQIKKPRIRTAKFGDGYQQRVTDGINPSPRSWSLKFTRLTADIDAIEAFLDARANAGVESFTWTPPSGPIGKWICAEWSRPVPELNVQEINAKFDEVFGE